MNKIKSKNIEELNYILTQKEFDFVQDKILLAQQNKIAFGEWNSFNENLKVIALNSSGLNDEVKEYHKTYTDIHITISGKDTVYIGEKISKVLEDNLENQDYCLLNASTKYIVEISENNFLTIKPGVIHCNVLEKESVKLVIKKKNA